MFWPQPTTTPADINAAAAAAQDDIDSYAANALVAHHADAGPSTSITPTATPSEGSVEPPIASDSAQAAGNVVTAYYAAIAARQYDVAYRLWMTLR